ncbi:copper amine oxidase N-terminal domain-containing protein [Paenibacillus provencensis]|uniref:Copper amine oxidase N-terminal domain-containing protein n=1 Tax=Paenibacillus provencensis TaxID=441151 RepID=A0ABW3PTF9_9BACL|nr:copper amine oxidase N-terminal domain-containing protein [Paenibacillus sp. MER 78]MCM3127184.1 copper amine oxidase N-terminal domain-containing protein [Paenibacillus sp. MER 78]
MRKIIITLALSLMCTLLISNSAISFANTFSNTVDNGKIENGRMLIPLRAVSEKLDAEVFWNQEDKSISITRGKRELLLHINSRAALLNNAAFSLDVPAKIYSGTTYIPARVFAEAFGGTALWSQQERKATITIGQQQVYIHTEPLKSWRMSQERINVLNEKINEATDLSSYSQIRTHFRPYFTDSFINKIIHSNGITNNAILTKKADITYSSTTEARMHQSAYFESGPVNLELVNRFVFYKFADNQWKVDDVNVGRQIIVP